MKEQLPWIKNLQPSNLIEHINSNEINKGIQQVIDSLFPNHPKKNIKFYVSKNDLDYPIHQNYFSYSRLKTAFKYGHYDLSIFMYVNALDIYSKKIQGTYKKIPYLSHKTGNIVIDLDKCVFKTIEELVKTLNLHKCPLPKLIIETSPNSYHMLYSGEFKEWTYAKRLQIVKKLFMCPNGLSLDKSEEFFKDNGVDVGYLKQDPVYMKLRIPGTINYKKSGTLTKDIVIAKMWVNPEKQKKAIDIELLQDSESTRNYDNKTLRRIEFLKSKFLFFLSDEDSAYMAEIIGSGWDLLKYNNYRILQTRWEKNLKIPQYYISRKLKKMCELGFMIHVAEYKQLQSARTYGAGSKLLTLIDDYDSSLPKYENYDINRPYVNGEVNDHLWNDIRVLHFRGYLESEIISIIMDKQKDRPKDKIRGNKELFNKLQKHKNYIETNYKNKNDDLLNDYKEPI